jgi:phage terminase small subunit
MPRGGKRANAGRKPDPNSARQKALAKKAVAAKKPAAKKAPAKAAGRGFTLPNGQKSPDAPPGWPFGTTPPEEPAAPAPDPDSDDGLTDEQRAGLSPLDYLLAVMRSPKSSKSARMTAAIQAAPYMHPKLAQKGKKEAALDEAKTKPSRFAAGAPPRLAAAGGKRVG